jgi:hypothetical protein
MNGRYLLDGHKPVECADLITWAHAVKKMDRRVAFNKKGKVEVSTVFLGLDHSFGQGRPVLFETMIFGGKHDQDQERYCTWKEAEKGHLEMCKKAFAMEEKS